MAHSGEHSPREILRNVVRAARRKADMTQGELAGAIGRTQGYVSKFENGQTRAEMIDVIQFCVALEIDHHTLMDQLVDAYRAER